MAATLSGMTLAVYRALVTIPTDTALPEDYITNSFHFKGVYAPKTRTEDGADIFTDLSEFYQAIDQDVFSSFISGDINVKIYDLTESTPRVPFHEDEFTPTAGTGNPLPTECALALSYQAAPTSGMAQARRRGRIFLGPLRDPVVSVVSGRSVITSSVLDSLETAASALATNTTADSVPWAVYSPKTNETESLVNSTFPATEGWIDNALDTIRSRGTRATARRIWT